MFLGYSLNSRAYRLFNRQTLTVMESVNVCFDEEFTSHSDHDTDDDLGPSSDTSHKPFPEATAPIDITSSSSGDSVVPISSTEDITGLTQP